ncbi:MAG: SIMPL domain-containing protein [Candidatus Caenarcaniphilales bacterium]|nr:SIMPL domain-containing protein [Candidatus Caenarcaniphilales bacterium]
MFRILITALILVGLVAPVLADDKDYDDGNYLSVSGSARTIIQPDIAEITLGFQAEKLRASDAQNMVSQKLASFINQLKAIGIRPEEIKTVENSLEPVRDYSTKRPPYRVIGYAASQKIRVRILGEDRLSLVSRIIDLAAEQSLNDIDTVRFDASAERLNEANRKVMALASEDALKTGKEVLTKLGLRVKRIKSINLNSNSFYPIHFSNRSNAYATAAPESDQKESPGIAVVMPGELRVDGTISMSIEFE